MTSAIHATEYLDGWTRPIWADHAIDLLHPDRLASYDRDRAGGNLLGHSVLGVSYLFPYTGQ